VEGYDTRILQMFASHHRHRLRVDWEYCGDLVVILVVEGLEGVYGDLDRRFGSNSVEFAASVVNSTHCLQNGNFEKTMC
jgi:hypothetical protein